MFGELNKVSLREIWPHEASDFTPWLAKNIEELGKALGMDLELTEQEASVVRSLLSILNWLLHLMSGRRTKHVKLKVSQYHLKWKNIKITFRV